MTRSTDRSSRTPSIYRPVADQQALQQLERRSRQGRSKALAALFTAFALCALLLFLNGVTTGFGGEAHPSRRLWSLFPILGIAVLLAPLVASELWLHPRAVRTQARLLARRGLVSRYGRILAWQSRLEDRLAGLTPPRPELVQSLAEAKEATRRRMDAAMDDDQTQEQARDPAERETVYALLDAYRLALGNLEIDALLDADFLGSAAGEEALKRTSALLQPSTDAEESEGPAGTAPRPTSHGSNREPRS